MGTSELVWILFIDIKGRALVNPWNSTCPGESSKKGNARHTGRTVWYLTLSLDFFLLTGKGVDLYFTSTCKILVLTLKEQ